MSIYAINMVLTLGKCPIVPRRHLSQLAPPAPEKVKIIKEKCQQKIM